METVSMLDIRRNAKSLVNRLRQGESFRITYRNRPVGELLPARAEKTAPADDPVYRLAESAENLGGRLDSKAADKLIYGA